jgi:hypothetical protein
MGAGTVVGMATVGEDNGMGDPATGLATPVPTTAEVNTGLGATTTPLRGVGVASDCRMLSRNELYWLHRYPSRRSARIVPVANPRRRIEIGLGLLILDVAD